MPVLSIAAVSIVNFRSYANAAWELGESGVVAITGRTNRQGWGDNGAGKSTLLSAITFCLYGKTLEGTRDADSVIKADTDYCRVEVQVRVDATVWTIYRSRGLPKSKVKTSLKLLCQAKDHTAGTMDMTQDRIEAMLGSYEEFTAQVVFSAARPLSALAELPGAKVKALLAELLGLGRFEVAEKKARDLVTEAEEKAVRLEGKRQRWRGVLDGVRRMAKQLRAPTAPKSNLDPDEAGDRLEYLTGRINKYQHIAQTAQEAAQALSAAKETQRQAKDWYERQRASYDTLRGGKCPTCGRRAKADPIKLKTAHASCQKAAFQSDAADLEVMLRTQQVQQAPPLEKLEKFRVEHQALTRQLDAYRIQQKEYQRECKAHAAHAARIAQERKEARRAIAKVVGLIKASRQRAKRFAFWAVHFGPRGIRSHLLDSYLAALSDRASTYARTFYGPSASLIISPVTELKDGRERDDLDIRVHLPGFAPHYENLSRGSKKRVDLCLLLGMVEAARTSRRTWRQLFIDEVLDGMDEAGSLLAVRAVRDLAKDRQVVVVTRNPRVISAADHVWTAVHDGREPYGTSRLEIA